MSIRLTSAINTAPIDALVERLEGINALVAEVGRDVYDTYADQMLARLQATPPKPQGKIRWTTERQRRAFFASQGFNGGIPHVRTGALSDAWSAVLEDSPGNFKIVVSNPAPAAKYVFGSLAKNPIAAARFQQGYLKDIGWPNAKEIVDFYLEAMAERFATDLRDRLGDLTNITGSSRRAYTNR